MSAMEPNQPNQQDASPVNLPSNPISPEPQIDTTAKLIVPKALTIQGQYYRMSLMLEPNDPRAIKSVAIEIFSKDATPVATYRTSTPIPLAASKEITRPDKLARVDQAADSILQSVTRLLGNDSGVEWNCEEIENPPSSSGAFAHFFPQTPSLSEFGGNPKCIESHLQAKVPTDQGFDRLSVQLYPHVGFMKCRIEAESETREWKIKANLDHSIREVDIRADLYRKAHELLVTLYLDGAQKVTSLLDEGIFGARNIPASPSIAHKTDKALSRGYTEVPDHSTSLEHSLSAISLQIGSRYAAIRIKPCSDDFSRSTGIVFHCSDKYPELTGFQIHHIETAYKLLASSSAAERELGSRMCSQVLGQRLIPLNESKSESTPTFGINSTSALHIEYWSPSPDISCLFSEAAADEIMSIPGIAVYLPSDSTTEQIRNLIDGVREIAAVRCYPTLNAVVKYNFGSIRCGVLNDGSIRVIVTNSIGGEYRTLLSTQQVADEGGPATVVHSLFTSFASSVGDRWMEIVGHIERLSGQHVIDPELLASDPQHATVPPFNDVVGASMIKESVRIGHFICASIIHPTPDHLIIGYAGVGCARLAIRRDATNAMVELVLKDNRLQELSISKPVFPSTMDGPRSNPIYRFRSDQLMVGTPEYGEIIQQAHNFIANLPYQATAPFWKTGLEKLSEPLRAILGVHMVCVIQK